MKLIQVVGGNYVWVDDRSAAQLTGKTVTYQDLVSLGIWWVDSHHDICPECGTDNGPEEQYRVRNYCWNCGSA